VSTPSDDQAKASGGEGQQTPGPTPQPRESASAAGERIQVIIEAAEKAAAGIIEDADAQARRYIDASAQRADDLADERVRVVSDLTDTLIRQAELVRRQSDELLSALDAARNELASRIGQELSAGSPPPAQQTQASQEQSTPTAQAPQVPHLQPVESERPDLQAVKSPEEPAQAQAPKAPVSQPPPPAHPIGSAEGAPSDGARLLAAQMAVAGSSRQDIEARLREEFGIQDASPILDGILGPG
jgi:hypothetical protein